jgi:chromosome segregation ATPase
MQEESSGHRITILEQQVSHLLPSMKEHMEKSEDKLDRLTTLVIELAEQSKRLPHIDGEVQQIKNDMHKMELRMAVTDRRQGDIEGTVKSLAGLRDDVMSNNMTKRMTHWAVGVVFTGFIGTLFFLLREALSR